MRNYLFLKKNVLYYQQLSIARYQVSCYANIVLSKIVNNVQCLGRLTAYLFVDPSKTSLLKSLLNKKSVRKKTRKLQF